jgi:signal transduction histidine kinase
MKCHVFTVSKMESILNNPKNTQHLLDMTAGTLLLLDKNAVCIDIMSPNDSAWFLQEDTLKGKNLFKLIPPSTYKEIAPNFKEVLEKGIISSQNYEMMLRGQTYYFNFTMQPYKDMVLCQYRDTTQKSLEQKELAKRNKEMTEIQEIAMIGRWVYNSDLKYLRYTGHGGVMEHDGIIDLDLATYSSYVLPDDRKDFNAWCLENMQGNIGETINFRIRFNDKVFYMKARTLNYEKLSNGGFIAEGYAHNVTEIQQSRNDINLLTHAVDNAVEYIVSVNMEGNLVFGNRMFRKSMNIPYQEDITHIKIWDIYSIVDDQNMWKRITQMVKEGNMEQGFIMLKPLPFFPEVLAIEANAFWVTDDSGIETIWFFGRDITDNIEAAKKLKAAKEKAENSERLKSAFLANMSHEIRTPLNAIVGFSRLVAEVESPEDKAEFCRIIEENNERLLHLINELLDLSKIEANMIQLKSESINMHTLCTEVYNRFNLQSTSEIQLINETKNINLYAFADKNRTIQVISNLIDNALKFTERGNIRFGCYPKGDQIEIYVSDTGIGIPKDKIASIFDRFVKANENMYGTGLGLSISKMLVEKMNGKISVQSVLGKGTTFKFTLPKG